MPTTSRASGGSSASGTVSLKSGATPPSEPAKCTAQISSGIILHAMLVVKLLEFRQDGSILGLKVFAHDLPRLLAPLAPKPWSYPAALIAASMQKSCSFGSSRTFPAPCERAEVGASSTVRKAAMRQAMPGRAHPRCAERGPSMGLNSR